MASLNWEWSAKWDRPVRRWMSTVKGAPIVETAVTLTALEKRLRRRLASQLHVDVDHPDFKLVRVVPHAEGLLSAQQAVKVREAKLAEAKAELRSAILVLRKQGIGFRDVASMLGVSYQRVQQIVGPIKPLST